MDVNQDKAINQATEIINTFDGQDPWHKQGKMFPYFVQKRCKMLIECIEDFKNG